MQKKHAFFNNLQNYLLFWQKFVEFPKILVRMIIEKNEKRCTPVGVVFSRAYFGNWRFRGPPWIQKLVEKNLDVKSLANID